MKILLTLVFIINSSLLLATPVGSLICWDNYSPKSLIPGYLSTLNGKTLDYAQRNSFVMNFEEVPTYWQWENDYNLSTYGWSVSECEDMNYFIFPRVKLLNVLSGKHKSLVVEYIAEGPDSTQTRYLRCVKLNKKNHNRPVFQFF